MQLKRMGQIVCILQHSKTVASIYTTNKRVHYGHKFHTKNDKHEKKCGVNTKNISTDKLENNAVLILMAL